MAQENIELEREVSLKDQLYSYLRYWPWFILSIIFTVTIGLIYLKYSVNSYQTQAKILIKDTNNNELSELAAFEDLGLSGGGLSKSEFENELEILRSKKLARQVVKSLDLNISYFNVGDVKNVELYGNIPIVVKLQTRLEDISQGIDMVLTPLSSETFRLSSETLGVQGKYNFGEKISLLNIDFTVIPDFDLLSKKLKDDEEFSLLVKINSFENSVRSLQGGVQVSSVGQLSSVVQLSMTSAVRTKAQDILNTLISVYNDDATADKNQVSKNTADFIEKRLAIISQELDSVESNMVTYKEERRLTNVESEGQIFLENASEFNKRSLEVATQLELVDDYLEYISSKENTILPVNLGLEGEASGNIEAYNQLILERNRLLSSAGESNPVIVQIDKQISDIRSNIQQSLQTLKRSISIQEKDLLKQQRKIQSQIGEIPVIEKQLRDIVRQQNIKESLYLYLLQKREETAISLAVTTPKAKIVDSAYSSNFPISPKPRLVYLGALLIGFLLPFSVIYVQKLLDTKIHNRTDIEVLVPNSPILGEVPQIEKGEADIIKANDRSVLAEAFRIVRTNLSYLLSSGEKAKKIIYVTSTIKGEGKTFVASNLALTLTSSGKSVLLIGADIRNPQIHRYVNKPDGKGLSEYLFDDKVGAKSIINDVEIHRQRFDVILSGRIPPNPAELLLTDRFKQLLDEVKDEYDYVMVDTAPTMLVTDTLLISQYADVTVYISRAEYTEKKLLNYPKELIKEEKLKNVAFIVNDVAQANFGYGTKYGYGYGVDEKKWYEKFYSAFRIRKKFRS